MRSRRGFTIAEVVISLILLLFIMGAAVQFLRKQTGLVIPATDPESFLVTKANHLEPDQEERARAWGAQLAARMEPATPRP